MAADSVAEQEQNLGHKRKKALRQIMAWLLMLAAFAVNISLPLQHAAIGLATLLLVLIFLSGPRVFWRQIVIPSRRLLVAGGLVALALALSLLASPVQFFDAAFWMRGRAWLVFFPLVLALRLLGALWRQRIVWALLAGAVLAAVLGLLQSLLGINPWHDVQCALGPCAAHWQVHVQGLGERLAAIGFFKNRTRFAHVLVVSLALSWAMALWGQRRRQRFAGLALSALFVSSLIFAYTRAALFAGVFVVIISIIICLFANKKNHSAAFRGPLLLAGTAIIGLLLLAAALSFQPLRARMQSSLSKSANSDRIFLWERAGAMIHDFGDTGLGFGNYRWAIPAYHDRANGVFAMRSQGHDLALSLWVELGALGVLAFVLFFIAMLRQAAESANDDDEAQHKEARVDTFQETKNPDFHDQGFIRPGLILAALMGLIISLVHDPLYVATEAAAWVWIPALLGAVQLPGVSLPAIKFLRDLLAKPWPENRIVSCLLWPALLLLPWTTSGSLNLFVVVIMLVGLVTAFIWPRHFARFWPILEGLLRAVALIALAALLWRDPQVLLWLVVAASVLWAFALAWRRAWLVLLLLVALPALFALLLTVVHLSGKGHDGLLIFARTEAAWFLALLFVGTYFRRQRGQNEQISAALLPWRMRRIALIVVLAVWPIAWIAAGQSTLDWEQKTYDSACPDAGRILRAQRRGEANKAEVLMQKSIQADLLNKNFKSALLTLRWAGLLRPQTFMNAYWRLQRAEFVLSYDVPQAKRVLQRVVRLYDDVTVLDAARLLSTQLCVQLQKVADKAGRSKLASALDLRLADDLGRQTE